VPCIPYAHSAGRHWVESAVLQNVYVRLSSTGTYEMCYDAPHARGKQFVWNLHEMVTVSLWLPNIGPDSSLKLKASHVSRVMRWLAVQRRRRSHCCWLTNTAVIQDMSTIYRLLTSQESCCICSGLWERHFPIQVGLFLDCVWLWNVVIWHFPNHVKIGYTDLCLKHMMEQESVSDTIGRLLYSGCGLWYIRCWGTCNTGCEFCVCKS
jgi:hypothetical protein